MDKKAEKEGKRQTQERQNFESQNTQENTRPRNKEGGREKQERENKSEERKERRESPSHFLPPSCFLYNYGFMLHLYINKLVHFFPQFLLTQ